jgi:hypothetical protein
VVYVAGGEVAGHKFQLFYEKDNCDNLTSSMTGLYRSSPTPVIPLLADQEEPSPDRPEEGNPEAISSRSHMRVRGAGDHSTLPGGPLIITSVTSGPF